MSEGEQGGRPDEEDMRRMVGEWRASKSKLLKQYDTVFLIAGAIFIIAGVVICIYSIPAFRAVATQTGTFVVPLHSLWWCLAGFAFHLVAPSPFRSAARSSSPSPATTSGSAYTPRWTSTASKTSRRNCS
jgi:hypothetical protein